jgi:hypothetical protein
MAIGHGDHDWLAGRILRMRPSDGILIPLPTPQMMNAPHAGAKGDPPGPNTCVIGPWPNLRIFGDDSVPHLRGDRAIMIPIAPFTKQIERLHRDKHVVSGDQGAARSALCSIVLPVFEISSPTPAVVWQAPSSGTTARNARRIKADMSRVDMVDSFV